VAVLIAGDRAERLGDSVISDVWLPLIVQLLADQLAELRYGPRRKVARLTSGADRG
jgi:hypothetical protein